MMLLMRSKSMIFILCIFIICFISVIHWLYYPIINHVDTMAYHAFARFIQTGTYVWTSYPMYKDVQTGSPPMFSLLLAGLYAVPRSDIAIHTISIIFYLGTSFFVYRSIRFFVSKTAAIIMTTVFFIIPGNIIYLSFLMPEIIAQFLFTIYIYLFLIHTRTKKITPLSVAVFIGFMSGLWKYSFVILGIVALIYFLLQVPRKLHYYIFPALGIGIVGGWILIQHSLTGVWGMSGDGGIRWNLQMMYRGRVLPPADDPSVLELRKYVPADFDLRRAYWDFEQYLAPATGYDYVKVTNLVGNVGKAAVRSHPDVFLRQVVSSYVGNYHTGPMNLVQYGDTDIHCVDYQSVNTCSPILSSGFPAAIAPVLKVLYTVFYSFVLPVYTFGLFFPSLLLGLFISRESRILSVIYLASTIAIAMVTWSDPRYILPFYPVMILSPTLMFLWIGRRLQFRSLHAATQKE